MSVYLNKYFNNINGMKLLLMKTNGKIEVFNQMKQSWQKIVEVLIALPVVSGWFGNIDVCDAIYLIKTDHERKYHQKRFQMQVKFVVSKTIILFVAFVKVAETGTFEIVEKA